MQEKPQSEETKQASEPDSDMVEILELLDQEFKITMINMPIALMEKVDNMQEQMGNIRREMETLRKIQKEMLEIKNAITQIKNAFDSLISRLGMAKKRIGIQAQLSWVFCWGPYKAVIEMSAEVGSRLEAGEERASELTSVVIGKIQFIEDCWTEGFLSFLAVHQRPPSVPCPAGLFSVPARFIKASREDSLLAR
ncbi:hypothetical protein HJG60_012285 [Phyllostomus discolor]|uniref:Uncharacterized protein n=1 Tax=Phyllostomus discolor TaxID=89673 RepID=A0A833ZHJ8_9CHIR|nr:hypothetical protein HJG60_012285 [Phyllostomus discolor]